MKLKTFFIILIVLLSLVSCKDKSPTAPVINISDPVIVPYGGTYTEAQTLTISCTTEDVVIRYTLDGKTPTKSSPVYRAPFILSKSAIIKVMAFKSGNYSNVITASYTIDALAPQGIAFVEGGIFKENPISSFYMSKYEIVQSDWEAVMTGNKNEISPTPSHPNYGIGANYPVNQVSWYDVVIYCNRRSIQEGLTPVYAKLEDTNSDNWGVSPGSVTLDWYTITTDASANGYRLPNERQWEWAARGGIPAQLAGTFNTVYAGSDNIDDVAWYWSNSSDGAKPAGTKAPNELGVFNMSGNVWEWCWDWKDNYYYRSIRGGSFLYNDRGCTVTFTYYVRDSHRSTDVGFRVIRMNVAK